MQSKEIARVLLVTMVLTMFSVGVLPHQVVDPFPRELLDDGAADPPSLDLTDLEASDIDAYFTENLGQRGPGAGRFYAEGEPISIALGEGWMSYHVRGGGSGVLVRVRFVGAYPVEPAGHGPLEHRMNFLFGSDRGNWRTGVRCYDEVWYRGLWDGVDLRFRFADGMMKYDLVLMPGADPSRIAFAYEGMDGLELDRATGDLLIHTPHGAIRDMAPVAHQETGDGPRRVGAEYSIVDGDTVTLRMRGRDPRLATVIDPGVEYTTLLGGSSSEWDGDHCVGSDGSIYLAASTYSTDFPSTPGAYDTTHDPTSTPSPLDVVVLRLSHDGSSLVYSTFIGDSGFDQANGICLDDDGSVVVAGFTYSSGFPVTDGAYDRSFNGISDAFVLRLTADGSDLDFSTLIGGGREDTVVGIGLDPDGDIYIAGNTNSADLPVTDGAYCSTFQGIFVCRLEDDGSSLVYLTYVGGSTTETAVDMCVDPGGRVFVTGHAKGTGFVVTHGALRSNVSDGENGAIVFGLEPNGSSLVYSCLFGGNYGSQEGHGIALDASGCAYVTGTTTSNGFPTTPGAFSDSRSGYFDAFLVKLLPDGTDISIGTLFGGKGSDAGEGVDLDGYGRACVVGTTYGTGFPVSDDAWDSTVNGSGAGFLAVFQEEGRSMVLSSLMDGKASDYAGTVRVQGATAYIVGRTQSSDFPTTDDAYCTTLAGAYDLFVTRIGLPDLDTTPPTFLEDLSSKEAGTWRYLTFKVRLADDRGIHNATVEYWPNQDPSHWWVELRHVSGDRTNSTWSVSAKVRTHDVGNLSYVVHFLDTSCNHNSTQVTRLPLLDRSPPEIEVSLPLPRAMAGSPYTITANVTDNVGVEEVVVRYRRYGSMGEYTNGTMEAVNVTASGDGTYEFIIDPVPSHWRGILLFNILATDGSGNLETWWDGYVVVLDLTAPSLEDLTPPTATTGDTLAFQVVATDNVGLGGVNVTYWFGTGPSTGIRLRMLPDSVTGRGNGTYRSPDVAMPVDPGVVLVYSVEAIDLLGNVAWANGTVLVVDDDPPVLVEDLSDRRTFTGEVFSIKAAVLDYGGLASVMGVCRFRSGPGAKETSVDMAEEEMREDGSSIYAGSVTVPLNASGGFTYRFRLVDEAGNEMTTPWTCMVVYDTIPPRILADLSDTEARNNMTLTFRAVAEDNVAIVGAKAVLWTEGMDRYSVILDGATELRGEYRVPWYTWGSLSYYITVWDDAYNFVYTETVEIPIFNPPPVLVDLPVWVVVEGEESRLDLTPYLQDPNDSMDRLSITCQDPHIKVRGRTLLALYPYWGPDMNVTLGITDGSTDVEANITVRITDINHPPSVRIISFLDGARYSEDELVVFRVDLEDLDMLHGQELEVVWTSNVSGELHRATTVDGVHEFSAHLPVGTHHLRVSVSDGSSWASDDRTITVTPAKERPGMPGHAPEEPALGVGSFDGLVVLVVVVLTLVSLAIVLHRYGKGRDL